VCVLMFGVVGAFALLAERRVMNCVFNGAPVQVCVELLSAQNPTPQLYKATTPQPLAPFPTQTQQEFNSFLHTTGTIFAFATGGPNFEVLW